jgi:hypothetical protein
MTPQKRKQGKTQSGKRKAVKTSQTKDVLVDELFDRAGMDLSQKTSNIAYSSSKMQKSTWMATEWCSMLR